MDITAEFDNVLTRIDSENDDYFSSAEAKFDTVRRCFATWGDGRKLVYNLKSNLRPDIKTEIITEHKRIFGSNAIYEEAD